MCTILGRKMKMEADIGSNKDWGLEKAYLDKYKYCFRKVDF